MDVANLAAGLNAGAILPEGIVILTLLVVLVGDAIAGRSSSRWTPYVAIAGLLASVVALYFQWDTTVPIAFLGSFSGDALSVVFRAIVALSALVTILMSVRYEIGRAHV